MSNEELNTSVSVVTDQSAVVDIDYVDGLLSEVRSFCSFVPKDRDESIIFANAMNNPTHRISDKINEVIFMKDVYIETLMMKKKDDKGVEVGEAYPVPRIVIFDAKGESYQAVSVGLYSALTKIIASFGRPTWAEPIAVKIKQISRKDRKMLTLECVSVKAPK
jgi:hypothetical protein